MAFGEYALMNPYGDSKQKFYSAIALNECYLLRIAKLDFDTFVKIQEKKALDEKMQFLRTIPEFHPSLVSRAKQQNLCQNLFPVHHIKSKWIFKENEEQKYVWFVREGELRICMRVTIP